LAPGVDEAFRLLHEQHVTTAIVSISRDFLVEWFARRFGASHWAALGLDPDGTVVPFWPEDKGPWLERLMATLDSPRDASLLRAAGHSFYVGGRSPDGLEGTRHYPDGNIAAIARVILEL